jgi:hypothetical protein
MQYTGLKDRTGKEIYEGDILQILNMSADGVRPFFKPFVVTIPYVYTNCLIMEPTVIGNIYENPELLESERTYGEDATDQGSESRT